MDINCTLFRRIFVLLLLVLQCPSPPPVRPTCPTPLSPRGYRSWGPPSTPGPSRSGRHHRRGRNQLHRPNWTGSRPSTPSFTLRPKIRARRDIVISVLYSSYTHLYSYVCLTYCMHGLCTCILHNSETLEPLTWIRVRPSHHYAHTLSLSLFLSPSLSRAHMCCIMSIEHQ